MPAKILVIETDVASRRLAGHALRQSGYTVVAAEDGTDPAAVFAIEHPDLLLLDAALAGADGTAVVRKIRSAEAGRRIPIIVLTPGNEVRIRVSALRAGADDTLDKPYHPAELVARVKSMLVRFPPPGGAHEARPGGRIFAIYGAKGGVGTTTIAVNLAIALDRHLGRQVVLVDGALQFGDHRVFLDLGVDRKSLIDVAEAASIDADFVQSVLSRHDSGIDVLLGPPSPETADLVTEERLGQTLQLLRTLYDYVIVDMDHRLDDINLRVMEEADAVFVVMTADLPSLKNTRLLLETSENLDFPKQKMRLVLNRSTAVTGINARSMEAALERKIDHQIVNEYYRAISSLNSGTPFMFTKADSKLGQSILEFSKAVDSSSAAPATRPLRAARARR